MVRKRRRAKYTWMPTLGGEASFGANKYDTNYFGGKVFVDATIVGPADIYVTPIVPDGTHFGLDPVEAEQTLRDLTEGQDWLLKRIVGKCVVGIGQFAEEVGARTPKVVQCAAAFFVARSDDENQDVPDLAPYEYDPLGTRNVRNPWIWRRRWTLMNGLASSPLDGTILEVNNTSATSALDGPHIDSKMARRIRREERLWFVFNAYGEDFLSGTPSANTFNQRGIAEFSLDYRVLGAMRRSNNRSTF